MLFLRQLHSKSEIYKIIMSCWLLSFEVNRTSKMELLLSSIDDVDVRDNLQKMNNPLHWAVSFRNREAIQLLVGEWKHSADL